MKTLNFLTKSFIVALLSLNVLKAQPSNYDEEYKNAEIQAQKILNQINSKQQSPQSFMPTMPQTPANTGESLFMNQDSTKKDFAGSSIRINPTGEQYANTPLIPTGAQGAPSSQVSYSEVSQGAPVELSEEQIALMKSAARAKNLNALQRKFFDKKSTGFENNVNIEFTQGKTQKIRTRFAMATTIIFDSPIQSYILGDEVGFKVEELPNLNNALAIKPLLIGIDTSLTVFTLDKKIHTIYLFSTDYKDRNHPSLVVYIKNEKTDNDKISKEREKLKKEEEKNYIHLKEGSAELKIKKSDIYDDYSQKVKEENRWLVAEEVFNDKQFTYFKYTKERMPQIPTVYVVIDGQDSPIETRVIGDYIVAETTAKQFTIRLGESYVCVVRNEVKATEKPKNSSQENIENTQTNTNHKEADITELFKKVEPKTKLYIDDIEENEIEDYEANEQNFLKPKKSMNLKKIWGR